MESLFKCLRSFVFIHNCGTFSRDFTTNLAPQCRTIRALKIEKLKAPLFRGAEDTNDWCIIHFRAYSLGKVTDMK